MDPTLMQDNGTPGMGVGFATPTPGFFHQLPQSTMYYTLQPPVVLQSADPGTIGIAFPGATAPNSQSNSPAAATSISGAGLLGIAVVLWFLFK